MGRPLSIEAAMTAPAKDAAPSLWEDLLEIFYAPTAVFERRRETPAFGLALLLFAILIVGLSLAFKDMMAPVFEAEFDRSMAQAMRQNPELTEEQMQAGRAIGEKFMLVGVAFYGLVTPLLLGVILWFAGKLVESKAEIGQVMMVATYAMYPRVLEAIINAVQMLIMPDSAITSRFSLSLGLGRFLDAATANPLLLAVLGRVDVFTLWITVIMAIGLSVMGRVPLARAAVAAGAVWVIGGLPAVWGAVGAG